MSFEHLAQTTNNAKAQVLAETLDRATEKLLLNDKSPKRKVGELDNRGSHFYLAMYWSQALAAQNSNTAMADKFAPIAKALSDNEDTIVAELNQVQGQSVDIGGYYAPDFAKTAAAMRPSQTLEQILAQLH